VSGTLSYAETERVVALVQKKGVVKLRARMSAWSDMREVWLEASDCWQGPAEAHIGTETDVPGWGSLHVCEVSDPSASSALPDGELLCPLNDLALPIAIRRWQPGDRIVTEMDRPAGRKVADLARRMTAPVDPRAVLVVTDAGRIIWAIGVARVAMPDEAVAETPYVSMSFVGCMNDDQRDSIGV